MKGHSEKELLDEYIEWRNGNRNDELERTFIGRSFGFRWRLLAVRQRELINQIMEAWANIFLPKGKDQ